MTARSIAILAAAGAAVVAAAAAVPGCASSHGGGAGATGVPPGPAAGAAVAAPAAPPETVDEQLTLGQKAFVQHCASCHGQSGQGSAEAPPVAGPGALPLERSADGTRPPPAARRPSAAVAASAGPPARRSSFHTAADVARFVLAGMPPRPRPKPTSDETWAILAFVLASHGLDLGQVVGPDNAAALVIHP